MIHSFGFVDGSRPSGAFIRDAAGNLYGTTFEGGSGCDGQGCGVVFKIDPSGEETVLHFFSGPDGRGPGPELIQDPAGNLYGTTAYGGPAELAGCANIGCREMVFELDLTGRETILFSFPGGEKGSEPGSR